MTFFLFVAQRYRVAAVLDARFGGAGTAIIALKASAKPAPN
jgi:hypothetical protein